MELETDDERSILVGVYRDRRFREEAVETLHELRDLAISAQVDVVEMFLQERETPDPAYLLGKGKLEEVRAVVHELAIAVVIFDVELTPVQSRNLERMLEVKVLDRTELILDIFAQRARSSAGKLQVELAQMEYLLPRLSGKGLLLSRLGGGIGTRGPGETKLEVDRRRVRKRLTRIKHSLERLERQRALHRRRRSRRGIPTISLVGYTNAGKSTLFSRLTGDPTYISSKMFATLDPLVRKIELEDGQEVLLSDTVGFIRKLPHTLIEAFQATLEEALESDLLVHVIDVSQPNYPQLRMAVYDVLEEIGGDFLPVLEVYNKIDLLPSAPFIESSRPFVTVSSQTGARFGELKSRIAQLLSVDYVEVELVIPFQNGGAFSDLKRCARVQWADYKSDGIHASVSLKISDIGRFRSYIRR